MRKLAWAAAALLLTALGFLYASCSGPASRPAPPFARPEPREWRRDRLTVAWLGHASVLIDLGGVVLLTDPVFFERIGLEVAGFTIGPKRLVESALGPAELPPIDVVLLSHAHLDSMDRPSLRAVADAGVLVTPSRTSDLVDDLGFAEVVELGWDAKLELAASDVEIEAVEPVHWGKRWPWEGWRGYNAYLVRRGATTVLFAPDTAYSAELARTARERGADVAIIGNGAYDPWIWNHADPEEVWRMFEESGAAALIPIHFDTFRLGREPRGDALRRLLAAAGPDADRIVLERIGETWSMPCCAGDVPAAAVEAGGG